MKLFPARTILMSVSLVALAASTVISQNANPPQLPPAPEQQPRGKVIFSRSIDENGQTNTQVGPAAPEMAKFPLAEDAERKAVTFTAFDLDVHLHPTDQNLAVRALVTVRNDGKTPLARIPLQLSSSLNFERIRVLGHDVAFPVATLNSDADHTGQLHEAAVPLASPLAPGQSLQLDVTYSGAIAQSAQRLIAIGTPHDVALHSDWDGITSSFTGLRGFGNVVWYPVSSVPVILGDGARLFDEMGEHKLRVSGAQFRLHLTIEFPHGQPPNVALMNGHPAPLTVTDSKEPEVEGVATAAVDHSTLGFEAPSLFVATRTQHNATNTTLWALPANERAVETWSASTAVVTPFLQGWLGEKPRSQLVILDLPDPDDAPFETGALLATSIREASPVQLQNILAHALTHAWMQSPRAWLSEGVAHFMGSLWVERQSGRTRALEELEANRPALALSEPASPGMSGGQPLTLANSPIYYRTKATYVFWMLRDLAGDAQLSAALRAYDSAADVSKRPLQERSADRSADRSAEAGASTGMFEKLLKQVSVSRDLSWFFADWIDADKGLPDLSIDTVFPARAQAGNYLVAVNISNAGYVAAEVPVSVRTDLTSVTQRVFVPAHSKAVQRILILGKPTQVQVNDGTVPETQATVHIKKLETIP
jgi:hypothetical protein